MTDEEKVTNGRNFRGSHQLRNTEFAATHVNITEINESVIKTAEEKLQDVTGNLLHSPDIEPSIYQTDVVTTDDVTTTTAATEAAPVTTETPSEDVTAEPQPSASADSEIPSAESKPPDQPPAETDVQDPAGEPLSDSEMRLEPTDAREETDMRTDLSEEPEPTTTTADATTPTKELTEEKAEVTSEKGVKPTSAGDVKKTTESTTTEAPTREPYQIDIPIQRKINKRTKRKLWEEIEKRKPLIPKYVERHIQKYAKPPFELWGCKFRGKGSCYGCGG